METMSLNAIYSGNSIIVGEAEFHVSLPKDRINVYMELIVRNTCYNLIDCLENIEYYQQSKPNYPGHQIADYCLYLGTFKHFDLYSYLTRDNYTTAIVYGSEDNEYMSGWIELALSDREEYKELFARESACGLITDNVKLEVAEYYIDKISRDETTKILNELRKKKK